MCGGRLREVYGSTGWWLNSWWYEAPGILKYGRSLWLGMRLGKADRGWVVRVGLVRVWCWILCRTVAFLRDAMYWGVFLVKLEKIGFETVEIAVCRW